MEMTVNCQCTACHAQAAILLQLPEQRDQALALKANYLCPACQAKEIDKE